MQHAKILISFKGQFYDAYTHLVSLVTAHTQKNKQLL